MCKCNVHVAKRVPMRPCTSCVWCPKVVWNVYKNKKEQPYVAVLSFLSCPLGVTPAGFKPATF